MIFNLHREEKIINFAHALAPTQLASLIERVSAYGVMPGSKYLLQLDSVQKDFLAMLHYERGSLILSTLKNFQSRNIDLSPLLAKASESELNWLKAKGIKL